jgi:hypothetical protein
VDHIDGKELFSATPDEGRYTKGASEFTMKIDPANIGVLLRRKLDYAWANQCARVYVADDKPDAKWHEVGLWYTAGSNTVVFSYPPTELGEAQHVVQTSNRRWREDEFMLPRKYTEGRSSIRIRCEFVLEPFRLFPSWPGVEQAWTEFEYKAYSFVMPKIDLKSIRD